MELKTWETPLGVKLTVAGKGGPWVTIRPHGSVEHKPQAPLKIPTPHNRRHTDRRVNQWKA